MVGLCDLTYRDTYTEFVDFMRRRVHIYEEVTFTKDNTNAVLRVTNLIENMDKEITSLGAKLCFMTPPPPPPPPMQHRRLEPSSPQHRTHHISHTPHTISRHAGQSHLRHFRNKQVRCLGKIQIKIWRLTGRMNPTFDFLLQIKYTFPMKHF